MQETLRKLRERRADGDRGFTLIELLVVVVIIGVLVAIAIPLYLNYRKGAENKSAQSDVRGAVSAVEQFYTENANVYPVSGNNSGSAGQNLIFGTTTTSTAGAGGTTQTATMSSGNTMYFVNNTTTYWICSVNTDGGTIYIYNSSSGGAVKKSSQATMALCVSAGT
ncbi:MAG: type pilus assembly protein PilA [Micromonosporaceae bacterium]|jgi:type IV pilus assembly protein PilA